MRSLVCSIAWQAAAPFHGIRYTSVEYNRPGCIPYCFKSNISLQAWLLVLPDGFCLKECCQYDANSGVCVVQMHNQAKSAMTSSLEKVQAGKEKKEQELLAMHQALEEANKKLQVCFGPHTLSCHYYGPPPSIPCPKPAPPTCPDSIPYTHPPLPFSSSTHAHTHLSCFCMPSL